MTLFHYTCDHGRDAIGRRGVVLPVSVHDPDRLSRYPEELRWLADVCWFTNQRHPDPVALGLTRERIACDRTRWRYEVIDPAGVEPWRQAVRNLPRDAWRLTVGDHRPGLWWVARGPVPVEPDT